MDELKAFIEEWQTDTAGVKPIFEEIARALSEKPDAELDFYGRPGVSYSLRARNIKQQRPLYVAVDVIDDDPDNRWLSVCFFDDMVSDPDEVGDWVPKGLFGDDARCFNIDGPDADFAGYVKARIEEAAGKARQEQ